MTSETQILNQFEQELKTFLQDDVRVVKNVDITPDMITVDAIVEYHGMIVAVVECVSNESFLPVIRRDISKILKRAQVQLGIVVTITGQYYIRKITNVRSSKVKIETIANEIRSICDTIPVNLDPQEVKQTLLKLFENAPKFATKGRIRPLFERACDRMEINRGRVFFQDNDEDAIMLGILGGAFQDGEAICRYTSLDSLFKMLDSTKHSMCSPVSMNDKRECDYADSFMPWHVNRSRGEVEIEADNSYFLLSCSDIQKSDDLTMWRLYGDNTKGVCIEYTIETAKIDNDQYILSRVSYGKKGKNGKDDHPELSFIAYLQSQAISPGWYFSFSKWYIWKFFFKSWTYSDENEIRLVYIPDTSDDDIYDRLIWYKDQSNGIFNRMALIPIKMGKRDDFPLEIRKLILGPQSPESIRNKEQIQFMADKKGIDVSIDFSVEVSSINNYR